MLPASKILRTHFYLFSGNYKTPCELSVHYNKQYTMCSSYRYIWLAGKLIPSDLHVHEPRVAQTQPNLRCTILSEQCIHTYGSMTRLD